MKKYKFNYGDGKFQTHKIFYTDLPLYIQEHYNLYENDWLGYVKILIDIIARECWFDVKCNMYGTIDETYCEVRYYKWTDVVIKKGNKECVRIKNDGPDDTPVDVFWVRIIDHVYMFNNIESHDAHLNELENLFLATIWFYVCECSFEDMNCIQNNYISPYLN